MTRRGVGIVVAVLGAAIFIVVAAFFTLYLVIGRGPAVPSNATLTLTLTGDLAEVQPADDLVGYLQGSRTRTLRSVVENLRKAKVDRRVGAVLLKPSGIATAYWGKVQEIRDAVLDLRESGKPVYAYLEYGGDREYYLAAAADKVFLMPSSSLDLTGVASYELFLRGTLDVLGVYPDLHHVGAYKNAVNTFTEKGFTDAHREAASSLNRGLYDEIVRGVAEGRGKNDADVRAIVDDGPLLPEQALAAGLVDELAYEDQVVEQLRVARGGESRAAISGDDYARVSLRSLGLNAGPRIAVIYAAGMIASGRSGFDPLNGAVVGADTLNEYIRRVRRDNSIRAIVLRIDSPGGSATASDAVWRELMLTKQAGADRPLVASMSDLAASGGYYIAMPADVIVAQPSTLTGSIGIFGGKFVTGGLYGKLGANIGSTSVGRRAEMNSPARPYNEDEVTKVEEQLQAFYDRFVENAAASRARTPEAIEQVAQGRVWTGRQALANGLVDALGGLDRAIAIAKERADIPADSDVELVVYPPRRSFFEILSEELSGGEGVGIGSWLADYLSAGDVRALSAFQGPFAIFRRGEPLALMPFAFLR
jgi:protease-4